MHVNYASAFILQVDFNFFFFKCVKKLGWVYTIPFEESKDQFSEQGSQVMPQNGYLRKQEQLKSESG